MAEDIRICFVGDSFVNGTGDETALGWAGRLCAAAHARGVPLTWYNLGIRRDTSRDVLMRWRGECTARLPAACDGRIVLSCGVNDAMIENGAVRVSPDESRANVRRMLGDAGKYRLLVVGPPPVADDEHNQRIMRLSEAFSREAAALGVPYVDVYSVLASDADYRHEIARNDGAHPRSRGYAKLAEIVGSSPSWWFRDPRRHA